MNRRHIERAEENVFTGSPEPELHAKLAHIYGSIVVVIPMIVIVVIPLTTVVLPVMSIL